MTIIEYQNTEFKLRSVHIDGEPWFVAKDVCDMLGIQNPRQAVDQLDEDEVQMASNVSTNDIKLPNRGANVVSESGLYALIFQSRKPEARAFRRWVTGEVLPQIRETGAYRMRRIDQRRVCEVKAGVEGLRQKLSREIAHLWKVQEVEGNVSLKAYLLAAGVQISPKDSMRLGARCNYRCKCTGNAVGKLQQRRGHNRKLSPGHIRHGWHLVATFPPGHITVELCAIGYEHAAPDVARLNEVMRSLVPVGPHLNPATPSVSLYLPAS